MGGLFNGAEPAQKKKNFLNYLFLRRGEVYFFSFPKFFFKKGFKGGEGGGEKGPNFAKGNFIVIFGGGEGFGLLGGTPLHLCPKKDFP